MIRVFEAFAGIGGFRSALEKTGGFEIVGWCEINHFAQKAYRLLFDTGKEEFYEDITKIDYGTMPDFDLLVGDPPCQSWSAAGLRKGFEDDRGNLFLEYIRLLEAKKPKYFVAENVAGLLSHSQGKSYGIILEKICELGYSMCWRVLNSADFGVAQDRKRVYLVGYLGERSPAEILAFGESGNEDSNDSGEKTKLKQLIGGSQGSRVYAPDGLASTQCSGSGGMGGKTGLYLIDMNPPPNLTEKARCITAHQDSGVSKRKGEHSAVFVDLNENPKITENAGCLHTRYDLGITNGKHKGERSGVLTEEGPRAIINPFKDKTRQNGRRIKEPNEPMFTLTVTDRHGIVHRGRIRRLMPVECWKLQAFTDKQFRKVQESGMSDAQLYKLAGNSITVNVMEAIAGNILEFERGLTNAESYPRVGR